ncbi:MAG TPA: hypothetical protein VGM29_17830 [Polyangiaceae bacterium]|jgi:hypothetical protein
MTYRLNARIDPELARKVKYLQEQAGQTTTQVVRESIEAHYNRVRAQEAPGALLADFVGSGSGSRELSANYKGLLTESLRKKVST